MNLSFEIKNHKSKVFLVICLSLIAGVILAICWPVYFDNRVFFILAWFNFLLAIWFWPKRLTVIFLIISFLFFGYWRQRLAEAEDKTGLRAYLGQEMEMVALIKAEPEVNSDYVKLNLVSQTVNGQIVKGGFLMFAPLATGYNYGDVLKMKCSLEKLTSSNGFDAEKYWRRFGICGVCQYSHLEVLAKNQGSWFYQQIINLRHSSAKLIKNGLPYPEADLGTAMVLGVGNKLNLELKTAFSQSGLTHLIAISGLNVSLLVGLLFGLALAIGLKRSWSLWLSLWAVSFYVVLVGAPASAVRAGIMGGLFLIAAWLGRFNKLINSLALAGAISLMYNPWLLTDIGWQLSFLALLGIIYVYPILRLLLRSSQPTLDFLLATLALTLGAQIATWPILALNFGQVSLVAPLANLLAVWTTPFILVTMFGALLLSWLWPWLGWWLPSWLFLKYLISVAYLSAKAPVAFLTLTQIKIYQVVLYYFILSLIIYFGLKFVKKKEKQALSSDKSNFLC